MEQVRAYQLELIRRGLSYPHIKQVSPALRFVFGGTLERPEAFERIVVAKTPKKLPIVLSRDEVVRLLHALSQPPIHPVLPVVGRVAYQLVWRPPAVTPNRSQTRWWHCHLTNPCPFDPASVTYSPSREVTSGNNRAQSP
jgi:hypothetical protein